MKTRSLFRQDRARLLLATLISTLVLSGCGNRQSKVELGRKSDSDVTDSSTTSRGSTAASASRADVKLVRVQSVEENRSVRLTGTLQADEKSEVASRIGGIVQEVLVDRGDVVSKGDVIARIDPIDAKNSYDEGVAVVEELRVRLGLKNDGTSFSASDQPEVQAAKADLNMTQSNFKRDSELVVKKVIPGADFDKTRNEYESARQHYDVAVHEAERLFQTYKTALVKLRTLAQAVQDTTVTAPFNGLVAEKHISPGERLVVNPQMAGGTVVSLVRIDPLRLAVTVPAQSVGEVRLGQTVGFRVDSFPDRPLTATITRVSPSMQAESRSLMVEALVPNADKSLRPGMFATADLQLPQRRTAVFVPASAVRREGEVAKVYKVEGGIAREQIVMLGEIDGDRVRVTTGLSPDATVVADASNIRDGMRVGNAVVSAN